MNGLRNISAITSSIAVCLLTACASAPKPEPVIEDWTNRACESPAYRTILGSYVGQIDYRDSEARACRWKTEISIIGVSMVTDCSLTGTISATPDIEGSDGYRCTDMQAQTRFVVGLTDTDLNRYGPTSVIIHLEDDLPTMSNNGNSLLSPVEQYQALTAENGVLITDAGNILSRR